MQHTDIELHPFDATTDIDAVTAFYNDVFAPLRPVYSWPVTSERFRDKVLQCWEYRPEGCWLACAHGRIVGLALAGCRTVAVTEEDRQQVSPPVAYISCLAVAPAYRRQGIGRALHAKVEQFARDLGCRMITPTANPSAPMAFFIAVPEDWHEAHAFTAQGYARAGDQQNLVRSLSGFAYSPEIRQRISELEAQGYACRPYQDEDHDSLIGMLDWPYWVLDIESKLGRWTATRPFIETCFLDCATADIYGSDEIAVIVKDGDVLSFCVQTINPRTGWAYLGPVMTRPEARSLGLGSIVVQLSLQLAAAKGAIMCDLWTDLDEHHSHFYAKNGFQRIMRWLRYEKVLV